MPILFFCFVQSADVKFLEVIGIYKNYLCLPCIYIMSIDVNSQKSLFIPYICVCLISTAQLNLNYLPCRSLVFESLSCIITIPFCRQTWMWELANISLEPWPTKHGDSFTELHECMETFLSMMVINKTRSHLIKLSMTVYQHSKCYSCIYRSKACLSQHIRFKTINLNQISWLFLTGICL